MIIIALGANLPSRYGAPRNTIAAALQVLGSEMTISKQSRFWRAAPVPVSSQPWYWNLVVAVETGHRPVGLLQILQNIEEQFGRTRNVRNEARILDIDLIAYNDEVLSEPGLTVPHPRMHERLFVLMPLAEIVPDWQHPVIKKGLPEFIRAVPPGQQVEAVDD